MDGYRWQKMLYKAFAIAGRIPDCEYTQGVALG